MKFLITGGCGFVGTNLAEEVLLRKEELVIYDNLSRKGSHDNLKWLKTKGEFTFINGDTRDSSAMDTLIETYQPEIIFHVAGQVAMTTSIQNPRLDFEVNALGTINLLEAVRKFSNNSVVLYSSTNKVYGDFSNLECEELDTRYIYSQFPDGFDESTPLDFHSPYGCSKGSADQYLLDYHRMFGLNTVVFRHSSMYGGHQHATYDQGWIGWFCQKAIEIQKGLLKEPFTISGDGKQVRDVLHASDVVNCYFSAIDNIKSISGQVFNIGGGMNNSLSLLELFDLLENELQIKMNYTNLPWRQSDQKSFVADIGKFNSMTGWSPMISKTEGIKKMIKWLKSEIYHK